MIVLVTLLNFIEIAPSYHSGGFIGVHCCQEIINTVFKIAKKVILGAE